MNGGHSATVKKRVDVFSCALVIVLVSLGVVFVLQDQQGFLLDEDKVHFFFSTTCPHCADQEPFNEYLAREYGVEFVYHDVSYPEQVELLRSLGPARLAVPFTYYRGSSFIGFSANTATSLEKFIASCVKGACVPQEAMGVAVVGGIDVGNYSLPVLAMLLGFLDGFNPCALWVLVFMISLIAGMRNRRRLWLLVGSFVVASAVLYFLFMSAWLNVFMLLGYVRVVTVLVGLFALYWSVLTLREFFVTGGIACPVEQGGVKAGLVAHLQRIVTAPLSMATLLGVVGVAFVVNAIEFVCSAVFPVAFTQILAMHDLAGWSYYAYLLLYDLFFSFNYLIVFGGAAFAVSKLSEKYAGIARVVSAFVLFLLGILLVFFPHLLR